MSEEEPFKEIRRQFVSLIEKNKKKLGAPPGMPTVWQPTSIKDPKTGYYFTNPGAWDFILDELRAGRPLTKIALDKPPGKDAYFMKIPQANNLPDIYIKLHFGGGHVIGRSFHTDR